MGAHVYGPAYLRDHLLTSFRLTGWSNDWYSGLPIYRFYMVVPALFILALDVFLPYGIALKLVAVAGILALPFVTWLFAKLARLAFPMPELLVVASTLFLYDESFTIYGGNIASTMAGEFSFSIALALTVLAFGVFIRGLETNSYRIASAVLLALAALCHGIVLLFAFLGFILILAMYRDPAKWKFGLPVIGTAILLSAFWVLPFVLNHAYMTDMKYKGEPGNGSFTSYWGMFFALPPFWNFVIFVLAVIGFTAMIAKRNIAGVWLGVTGLVFTAFVYLFNDSLPIIGLLWNPRLLPMLNMCRYLLAGIGAIELASMILRLVDLEKLSTRLGRDSDPEAATMWESRHESRMFNTRTVTALVGALLVFITLGWRFQVLPFGSVSDEGQGAEYNWGPFEGDANSKGFVDGWAKWNFTGYEGRSAYGEYYALVQTMKVTGEQVGCGRALWENYSGNDKYGTTMALMLLPFWTDGCIGSSEGLFFEAAGTTPYHFLAAGAMSKQSSNPVRELRYVNNDASVGVSYMQELGIRYYLAVTPEAIAKADEVVADGGPLKIGRAHV